MNTNYKALIKKLLETIENVTNVISFSTIGNKFYLYSKHRRHFNYIKGVKIYSYEVHIKSCRIT